MTAALFIHNVTPDERRTTKSNTPDERRTTKSNTPGDPGSLDQWWAAQAGSPANAGHYDRPHAQNVRIGIRAKKLGAAIRRSGLPESETLFRLTNPELES